MSWSDQLNRQAALEDKRDQHLAEAERIAGAMFNDIDTLASLAHSQLALNFQLQVDAMDRERHRSI